MPNKVLNLACWDYDRVEPLINGKVKPAGIDLKTQTLWIQEIFYRMLTKKEFDVSELSFGAYVSSLFNEKPPFAAIPVFTSRMFRHGSIYVNRDSKINKPEDLKGKKVGLPEYRQTAVVWIKGMLKEKYGVQYDDVEYHTGPLEKPGGKFFFDLSGTEVVKLHKDIKVGKIPDSKTLSDMLYSGEIDALYSALEPSTFKSGDGKIVKLFEDSKREEEEYYRETSIFPMMHVVVMRRDIFEKDRWIAKSLYEAFLESKDMVINDLIKATGALKYSLPWLREHVKETVSIMGTDYWPYGLEKNRNTLSKFLEYMYDQGITPKLLDPKDLFPEEVWTT